MKPSARCLAGAIGVSLALLTAAAPAQTLAKYTFSVVPQYSLIELHKDWSPLLQRISLETGVAFELKVAASIPRFEADFMKGTPDFAYMNPYHAVMAKKSQGYLPLLRDSKPLTGILLARRDSPIKSPRDLNGHTIGFPAPNAFGASLYMRALLTEEWGIKFDARYLGTHSSLMRQVVRKEIDAGGSVIAAYNDEVPEVRDALGIIYKTPAVASHPVAVHPRVPEQIQKAVLQSFFNLTKTDAGRAMLKEIRTPEPVTASYERDYLPLEKLNIEKYLVTEKE